MTLDPSALLTQLDALKGADPASVFAELIRGGLQALIDAEATGVLGQSRAFFRFGRLGGGKGASRNSSTNRVNVSST
jgi:hypothetical protein